MSRRDAVTDAAMMAEALRLAATGLGTTAPNPSVGAVVALSRDGATPFIVGRGVTQPGGRPHAEFEALREAGDRARGASLYVTLEPCSHVGRGPACADVIVAAGIARVIVGIGDPDSRVAGDGITRLRAAGIGVDLDVQAAEARWLTLGHILRVTEGRPFVQMKIAVDRDGLTPTAIGGRPQFVTGETARIEVHRMRGEADAIVTGIGTVLADDPDLRPRLSARIGGSPIRIVLDSSGRLPSTSRLATSASAEAPVWQVVRRGIVGTGAASRTLEVVGRGGHPGLDVANVLHLLAAEGLTRIMVEAGPTLAAGFLAAQLVDEVVVLRSHAVASRNGHRRQPFGDRGLELLDGWTPTRDADLGGDRLIAYRHPRHHPPPPAGDS